MSSDTATTCDTSYHTALTNCASIMSSSSPTISNSTPSSCELDDDDDLTISEGLKCKSSESSSVLSSIATNATNTNTEESKSDDTISPQHRNNTVSSATTTMSDSGVCLDTIRPANGSSNAAGYATEKHSLHATAANSNPLENLGLSNRRAPQYCESDEELGGALYDWELNATESRQHSHCPMTRLRQKIATQKALIMKNLEINVDKSQLDEQIAHLQELQQENINMEKKMLEGDYDANEHMQCCHLRHNNIHNSQDTDNDEVFSANGEHQQPYSPSMTRSWPSMREFCK